MSFELAVLLRVTAIFGVTALAALVLRRASASTRHMVWCVGFLAALVLPLGLATLPVIELPLLISVRAPARPEAVPAPSISPEASSPEIPGNPIQPRPVAASPAGVVHVPGVSSRAPAARAHAWGWGHPLGWGWVLGSVVAFLRLLSSNWEVLRLKRLSRSEFPDQMRVEIEALKRDLSVSTPVDVRIGIHDISPMTCGLLRQTILLPPAAAQWTEERWRIVLAHELAHAKRHDTLIEAFVGVVCVVYWFHPATWLAARRMRLERERACDDVVLSLGIDAGDYVAHLLSIAREINFRFSPAAVSMAHPWQLESRLRAILDSGACRRTPSRRQKALLLASGILVAGGISSVVLTAVVSGKSSVLQSNSAASQGDATLEGTVVDALTGRPITGAEVRIATGSAFPEFGPPPLPGLSRPPRALPKPAYSGITDSSGRFIIQSIRTGTYSVGVSATGYANEEVGQTSPDRPGGVPVNIGPNSAKPILVRLTPVATLGGRITNDARQPVKDVPVLLLWPSFDISGHRRLRTKAMTTTTESGTYEFSDVPPGPYYVLAGRGASLIKATRSLPLYGWTFYPGRSDASLAIQIDASPGTVMSGLDFFVSEQQPRRIRGTVIDSRTGKPPENAQVWLQMTSLFEPPDLGGTLPYDPLTGAFEATGLVDGVYAIGVTSPVGSVRERYFSQFSRDAWARFEISGADVDNLVVRVPRAGYIRGRIALEGNLALSEVYPASPPSSEPSKPWVGIEPTGGLQPLTDSYRVDIADGTFEVPHVLSGTYRVRMSDLPAGYYMKTIRLNGATVPGRLVDFHPDEKTQLDITIALGAGEIKGVVLNDRREPVVNASGLLLPDPLPYEIEYSRSFSTGQSGSFTLSGIPPGRYRIYVFDGLFTGEFPEPDVLRRSGAFATPVVVAEGSRLSITAGALQTERTK